MLASRGGDGVFEHKRVRCGALRAYIVDGDDPDLKLVAAWIGDGEPWCCLPFGDLPSDRLIPVDETRVLVSGRRPMQTGDTLALLDVANRAVVAVARELDFQNAAQIK